MKRIILSSIFVAFVTAVSFGAEFYVATNGDDSATGTLADPLLTIEKAKNLADAVGGGTIYIMDGTYAPVAQLATAANKPVHYVGYSGNATNVVIDGKNLNVRLFANFNNGSTDFTLRHVTVVNCTTGDGNAGGAAVNIARGHVSNCIFRDNNRAKASVVFIDGNTVVENCLFYQNGTFGQSVGAQLQLGNHKLYTNLGSPVALNCTLISDKGTCNIYVGTTSHTSSVDAGQNNGLAINCLDIDYSVVAGAILDDGTHYFNCAGTYARPDVAGWTKVFKNEVIDAQFRPLAGSAIVDAGSASLYDRWASVPSIEAHDLSGTNRLIFSTVDIGAYENAESPPSYVEPSKTIARVGENLSFRAFVGGGTSGLRYRWTFGDGSASVETDEPTASYAYIASGVYTVSICYSSDGGLTWSDEISCAISVSMHPDWVFVSKSGDDLLADGTECRPFATIKNGIVRATAENDRKTVFVCAGTYAEHGLTITSDITVRGEGHDKTIVDGETLGRVFYVDNPSAVLANMTIRNGKVTSVMTISKGGVTVSGASGANVCLVDGMVTNCIVKNGYASNGNDYACGGNLYVFNGLVVDSLVDGGQCEGFGAGAYMHGGRLSRCEIVNSVICPSGRSLSEAGSAGVHAWASASDAIIENCLIVSNKCLCTGSNQSQFGAVCDIAGTDNHTMILVNCTIADNSGSTEKWAPCIRVTTKSGRKEPKLINCLLFNNGNTAWLEWGNARSTLSYFHNCASTVEISGGDNCTVVPADAAKVFTCGGVRPFEPAHKSALCGNGSAAAYADYAVATKDIYGKKRFVGDSIDIGCAERQGPGFSVIVQ